jgi:hypothetical protein
MAKAPEVTLDKILGGLAKVLTQLEAHKGMTDQYVAAKEMQIDDLQHKVDVAKKVAERSTQVAENLKSLLVID